ncbi:tetratricopeptide repeat protein 21B [Loa loa]|uniref:Tetratricopeptide repeat protein 21B n=1 Tax=Loa loa TaxID=7209 RepID=A0A1S0UKN6_LOALO|nr:tetratricopeptide repeat protein 21B [Loa loa]EJD76093.1 tetratricopeptide repeat protein 21B [Loa loa]
MAALNKEITELDWLLYCNILYHLQEGYYGTVLTICDEELHKASDSRQLMLFRSIALIKHGQYVEVIRLLHLLRQDAIVGFAASVILRTAHALLKNPDREEIFELDRTINEADINANMETRYNAAIAYMLLDNNDKARSIIEKSPDSNNIQFIVLQAWIELHLGKDINTAQKLFKEGIAAEYPSAYIGMARLLERQRNLTELRQVLYTLMKKVPTFLPGYIEYCKAYLMGHDWEHCIEQVQRTLLLQNDCLHVRWLEVIHELIIKGRVMETENALQNLAEAIEKNEPKNYQLHHKIAQLIIRITASDHPAAKFARKLIDRVISMTKNQEYLYEQVRLLLQGGDFKTAESVTLEALKDDVAPNEQLLIGVAQCFIAKGHIDDAVTQMEFVKAAHPDICQTSLYIYLMAVLDKEQHKPLEQFLQKIRNAVDLHLSALQSVVFGVEYLILLDPNLLIDMALQLYEFAPLTPTNSTNVVLKEIDRILTLVRDFCPALLTAMYLLAKAKYLSMDFAEAERLLESCTEKNGAPPEAYLLMAQIHLHKNNYEEAGKCLDIGLSNNFKVREHPLYHLIRAKLQKNSKQIAASIQTLQKATELTSFKANESKKRENLEVVDADRIAIYLELMDSYQQLGQLAEVDAVMKEAHNRWAGKTEQQQFVLMEANLKLQRKDVNGALEVLASVSPTQANYQAARIKMAEIYLNEKKDKRKFAVCFKELAQNSPSPVAYILLGDAYMSIQEPARAIEVYETALKSNPKDDVLAEKIGQAYVQCHFYTKAINYYEAALKSGRKPSMRMRLAELLFQLEYYEKCEKVLRQALDADQNPVDIARMSDHVSYLSLLSKLHFENGNWKEASIALERAREIQLSIIAKPPGEVANLIDEKKLAAKISCQLAELHWNRRDANKAIDLYQEAVFLNDTDIKIMTALANLYLSLGKLDACNTQCQLILNIDRSNDDATLMMADLLYQSNEAGKATIHFTQLLNRNPNQYHALARCIELSWRRGNVEQAEKYLRNALSANPRATLDAGFNYCKGLHEWYTGDPNAALQAFNRARRDLEWGERATYNMIEICLNPDNEIIGGGSLDYNRDCNTNNGNDREVGTKTAERFLKELQCKPGLDYKYRLMENFIMLMSSNRGNVQQALTNFLSMAKTEDPGVVSVGALLGSARAYLILKQIPKAKAQLKRALGYTWTLEDADYLEKCWLLLVDVYINQSKNDQASDILRTVLQHNASSIKAFEYKGYICEREQKWDEAAANYEEAWRLSKCRNPTVGYKLAYNYLKCRKLFECIEICHRVLELYPNYPRIKREIMDKARASIRT